MTTFLRQNSNPRLPAPDRYAAYLDTLIKRQHRERRSNRIVIWSLIAAFALPLAIMFGYILISK